MGGKEECGGSKDLPPDEQRCSRDNHMGWRCKEWKSQDNMYCQKHINYGRKGKGKVTEPTEESNAERVGETEETHFTEGQEVEVTSVDEGLKGAWFTARIIKLLNMKTKKILVEYNALLKNQSVQLRETVDPRMVRPLPPSLPKCSFHEFQIVDALHNDGWWKGKIIRVFKNSSYLVNFSDWKEDKKCGSEELRVHQDWVDGTWVFPQNGDDNAEVTDQGQQTQTSKRKRETRQSLPLKKKLTGSALSDTFPTASGTINEHLSPNCYGQICPAFSECEIQLAICDNTNEIDQEKEVVEDQTLELIKTTRQLEEMALEPSEEDTRCQNLCREATNQVQTDTTNFNELMVMKAAPNLHVDSSPTGVSSQNQLALGLHNAIENEIYVQPPDDNRNVAALEYVSVPFEKRYDVWGTLDKWNVFRSMPQHPHFQSLSEKNEDIREGKAIGYILSFAAMVEKVSKFQHDDPASHIEEYLKTLKSYEDMGFEVELIRSRLEKLLSIKAELGLFYGESNQFKEKISEEKLQLEHLMVKAYENNEKKRDIEEAIAKLKEKRQILVTEKQTKDSSAIVIQKMLQDIQEEICRVDANFIHAAAHPW